MSPRQPLAVPMCEPESKTFEFERLLTENDLCQSWAAVHRRDGRPCFVKTLRPNSSVEAETQIKIVNRAYQCQRLITSDRIIKATGKRQENGRLFVVYPWVDADPLSPEVLLSDGPEIVVELFLTVGKHQLRSIRR